MFSSVHEGSSFELSWLWEESVICGDWLLLLLVELVGGGSVINGAYPVQFYVKGGPMF